MAGIDGAPCNSPPTKRNRSLEFLQGNRQARADAERHALALLAKFREAPRTATPADRLALMLNIQHGRGAGTCSLNLRAELLFILEAQDELPIKNVCRVFGISSSLLFKMRQKDPEVDQAVKNYQASFFENEAMTGDQGLHPALTIFGLKARAGWLDAKDKAISAEQMASITDRFIDILRKHITDQDQMKRIVQELMGQPIDAEAVVS